LLRSAGLEVTADFWTVSLFLIVPLVQLLMFLFLGLSPVIHWLVGGRLMPAWLLYLFGVVYIVFFLIVTIVFSNGDQKCEAPADYTIAWCEDTHFTAYCAVLIVTTIIDTIMGGLMYAMHLSMPVSSRRARS
jgi:hypothetical protein